MIKQSINKRFNKSVILAAAIVLLVFSIGVVIYGVNRMNNQLAKQLDFIAGLSHASLQNAIWNVDDESVNEILDALLLHEDVIYLAVTIDGKISSQKARPLFEDKEYAFFKESSLFICGESPIFYEEIEIAKIRIVVSRANLKKELAEQVIYMIMFAVFLVAVIILRSIAVMRQHIIKPIIELGNSASSIAGGNLDTDIVNKSSDEIGSLSISFNTMRESIKKLITDLNKVNQDLEQRVEERTRELASSNEELKTAKEEADASGISKTALNELSDLMHGGQDITELGNKVTRYISEFLKIPLAGLFAKNNSGALSRVADFGYAKNEGLSTAFELGSGIIGQAAKEGKPITLKYVPEYAKIAFGFGEAAPNVILVYPLVYNDQTIAVLELGNFNNFSETQLGWIKQAGKSITLALQSVISVSELRNLMRIEWNNSYDVGIKELNKQHERLFYLVNTLFDVIGLKDHENTIDEVMDGLIKYTVTHFEAEEKLMQENNYPEYEYHKEEHNKLAMEVSNIYSMFKSGKKVNTVELLIFLVNWLKNHIEKTDKKYGPFLNQKGIT